MFSPSAVFLVTFVVVAAALLVLFDNDRSVIAAFQGTRVAGLAVAAAALVVAVIVTLGFKHRWRIVRSADNAAVSTLAAGVKAKRKAAEKASAYRQRIIDRADNSEPPRSE